MSSRHRTEDIERSYNLSTRDNQFLKQEISLLKKKNDDFVNEINNSQTKNLDYELKLTQLTDQLISSQLNSRNNYDLKIDKEITKLREESNKEIEFIKTTSREIHERENK